MNVEDLMKAQAEALEMLADQQMRMIRDKEVQEAPNFLGHLGKE